MRGRVFLAGKKVLTGQGSFFKIKMINLFLYLLTSNQYPYQKLYMGQGSPKNIL